MKNFIGVLFLLTTYTPCFANDLWRNSYDSPYSNGPSYSDGYQDYNDVSNTYGSPLGGPTLEADDGTHYQCDSYGTCYEW